MMLLKDLNQEEKITYAKEVNVLKKSVEDDLEKLFLIIEEKEMKIKLANEKIDLSLPSKNLRSGNKHPLNIIIDEISSIFVGLGYHIEEGPEVESDHYNFEMLILPKYIAKNTYISCSS